MATQATRLKIGPKDHAKPVDYDDFMAAKFVPGFNYEIIDGRVYVLPLPNPPENRVDTWLLYRVASYSDRHPEVINYVTNKSRVIVRDRPRATAPEPDQAAYHNFPLEQPFQKVRWQNVSPILVVEVVSREDPYKDLVRNVKLYLQVPTIQEYWLIDPRKNPERPIFRAYRRQGKKWRIVQPAFGEVYTTKLLPDFALIIDPRS